MKPPAHLTVDPSFIGPDDHLSATASLVVAELQIVLYALLVLLGVLGAVRWWRRARLAEKSFDPSAALAPGEMVVHGTVEYAANQEVAVRVEVDQDGSESESSGSWTTSWKEYNRRVKVRPFYLRHAAGQRIRVEPTTDVELVDDMDGVIRVNLAKRVRVAELTPGEGVFAHGRLEWDVDPEAQGGGYRGGQRGLVMRARAGGPMLLSSEPLGKRYRRRMKIHRGFAIAYVIVWALVNLALVEYYSSLFAGKPGEAMVTQLKHIVEQDSEGDDVHTYRVWLMVKEPVKKQSRVFEEDVDSDLFKHLKVGMDLPVRVTEAGFSSIRLGSEATFVGPLIILIFLPLLAGLIANGVTVSLANAWYEGELSESESGRLEESYPPPPGQAEAPRKLPPEPPDAGATTS